MDNLKNLRFEKKKLEAKVKMNEGVLRIRPSKSRHEMLIDDLGKMNKINVKIKKLEENIK